MREKVGETASIGNLTGGNRGRERFEIHPKARSSSARARLKNKKNNLRRFRTINRSSLRDFQDQTQTGGNRGMERFEIHPKDLGAR